MLRATRTALGVEYAIRDVVLPAQQLEAEGHEILKLNIGDPNAYDFDTPQHIKDALVKAVQDGGTANGYAPSEGIPQLRQAIHERELRRNETHYDPAHDIAVTTGVTEGLQMLYAAALNPGDEVLVPGPSYPPYTSLARLYGARAVPYRLLEDKAWQPDIDEIRRRITPQTKMICVINPNNPTGSVAGRRVIDAIGGIAAEYAKQLFLVSDEIYDELTFNVKHHATAKLVRDVPLVTFNGLSKVYLAPGWRLGWTLWRDHDDQLAEIRRAYMNQARLRLSASSIAQHGATAALTGPQDHIPEVVTKLTERRDLTHKRLNEIDGLSCTKPDGAFYAFPRIDALETPGSPWRGDKDFVLDLLKHAKVLTVHGSGFDKTFGAGHFRTVILPPKETLEPAFKAIEKFMAKRLKNVAA